MSRGASPGPAPEASRLCSGGVGARRRPQPAQRTSSVPRTPQTCSRGLPAALDRQDRSRPPHRRPNEPWGAPGCRERPENETRSDTPPSPRGQRPTWGTFNWFSVFLSSLELPKPAIRSLKRCQLSPLSFVLSFALVCA